MASYKTKAKTAIASNIKKYRTNAGLTQTTLSVRINKSSEYISRIERGVMLPGIEVLFEIADILNIEPYKLMEF